MKNPSKFEISMTINRISKLIALVFAFFLLSGFEIGSNYQELYKVQAKKAEQLEQQNIELREEKARLEESNEYLKLQIKNGLSNEEREKALLEREKQLNYREKSLDERQNNLNQRETTVADEERKIGVIEGRLPEIVARKNELKQEVESLREAKYQAENGKNFWKNITVVESIIFASLMLLGFLYLLWGQKGTFLNQSQPQTINLGREDKFQLSDNQQENKSLPNSEESATQK